MEIWKEEDADRAAAEVGFPMIVKPQMGAGSAGMSTAPRALVAYEASIRYL
jgi:biotin carboxylase